jgi:predicted DsbA family dithiol-disulfide isomerase
MEPNPIIIDIVSDIVCPWCWLGKKHLDTALADRPNLKVTINWHPFMLDPSVPETGVPYKDYMRQKFGDGPSDKFKSMRDHLESASRPTGINFRFDDIPMRPNTLKAHCLLKWASGQDKGHVASEKLFKSFFDDLKDIGDDQILIDVANDIGMDGKLVADLLNNQRDQAEVQAELDYFRRLGVTGVPMFIYNGTFSIQGGQPAEVHQQALDKAASIPLKDVMSLLESDTQNQHA